MYLKRLNEEQKELFLDLCISAALSNDVMEDVEKELIAQYCEEMQLDEVRFTVKNGTEEATDKLIQISSNEELRMILVEITALVLTDNQFDELEKQFVNQLLEKMNISKVEFEEMQSSIKEISSAYTRLNSLVFG